MSSGIFSDKAEVRGVFRAETQELMGAARPTLSMGLDHVEAPAALLLLLPEISHGEHVLSVVAFNLVGFPCSVAIVFLYLG
jgi:hypothetical protein